jgi:hypothetical protein
MILIGVVTLKFLKEWKPPCSLEYGFVGIIFRVCLQQLSKTMALA